MTTLDRDSLIRTAETLLALADALTPQEPVRFFGVELKPGEGWRTVLQGYEAERLANLALEAPFGREPDGRPKPPPAFAACSSLIDAATREAWPGPHGHPFSRWDYIRGIEGLYVGAPRREAPRYANRTQQFEDDVRWLCASPAGKTWLAVPENRAVTGAEYVRLAGYKPVERQRDGSLREVE
ncbi:MAG: hypothetical protein IPM64_17625 [Phycisphaerales bacterium]|nr:hypothetical protein [Phycisphaerales bacterium]